MVTDREAKREPKADFIPSVAPARALGAAAMQAPRDGRRADRFRYSYDVVSSCTDRYPRMHARHAADRAPRGEELAATQCRMAVSMAGVTGVSGQVVRGKYPLIELMPGGM